MKITIELEKDEFQRLAKDGNWSWKDIPRRVIWTRDTIFKDSDHYPCYIDFPSKYPCEVTSPWDNIDSFRPQDFPMTID